VPSIDLKALTRIAYDAYRGAQQGSVPRWDDIPDTEQKAWRAAVSAVNSHGEATLADLGWIRPEGRDLTRWTLGEKVRILGEKVDDVGALRDEAVAKGITINGLVILSDNPMSWNPDHTNPPGGLDNYYRNNVIGGPGAFVMVAQNFNSFGQAIITKMIAEVAQMHEPRPLLSTSWRASAR